MLQQGRKEGLLVVLISPGLRTHTEGTLLSTHTELETSTLTNRDRNFMFQLIKAYD